MRPTSAEPPIAPPSPPPPGAPTRTPGRAKGPVKGNGKKALFAKQGPLGRLAAVLHLWGGLASGLVILIVALTGALYAFQPELTEAFQPYLHVEQRNASFLPVSSLKSLAEKELPGKKVSRISYAGADHSVAVSFNNKKKGYNYNVYLDPYTGTVLKVKDMDRDFFRQVLHGHMHLWLPDPVGKTIVIWATLLFGLIIITGIIMWWPQKWSKATRRQSFSVKWDASPKRLNYDLHNVFGFYASWIMIFVVLTGLVWGFEAVRDAEYSLFSGGKSFPEAAKLNVKKPEAALAAGRPLDAVEAQVRGRYASSARIQYLLPAADDAPLTVRIFPEQKRHFNADYLTFNPYTAAEIPDGARGKYADANGGEKANRLNYDIHTGGIGGLPLRLVVFLAALVTASLPVTGFYIWWGKRKKQQKPSLKK
ncbi:PepSY-associated TM helix domain-containing protein [Paraflavisolibacter sp. H34]|uniref:PepSY-associated TM helix domain-containing protein n=1 Tax=Huijunlia imazamoxiresistens TaxID=3127457 RepID=UPI0030197ECE